MKYILGNIKRKQIEFDSEKEPLILASIGASDSEDSLEEEFVKATLAEKYGADIIIDHTLTPLHYELQKRILENTNVFLSSIAVYDMASMVKYQNKKCFTKDDVVNGFLSKAKLGLDFITVHATILKEDLSFLSNNDRIMSCTSRGGTMVAKNMLATGEENYYWTYFDDILDIAKKYNVTISLGNNLRAANISDFANKNSIYWKEVKRQGILCKKALDKGVNIIVEGIGHCPMNLIPEAVRLVMEECHYVPYRVLTVATDNALGFDHVSSAIASSVAVMAGASFITAVSRSEHLGLPTKEHLVEAITTAKIAGHCGYVGRTSDYAKDEEMAKARKKYGCKGTIEASIIPEITKEELIKHKINSSKKCTMCGDFCALSTADFIKGQCK